MPTPIDRGRLRVVIRKLDSDDVLDLLDRAIGLLPKTRLAKLIEGYITLAELNPDSVSGAELLSETQLFHTDSLSGFYYEAFNVNSRNYREQSHGTQTWIAECERLLDGCVAAVKAGAYQGTGASFELIFNQLYRINAHPEQIIFFADEHGAWQVGVYWERVMPAWFACLAASASPAEYAEMVHAMIGYYAHYNAAKYLAAARRVASPEQIASLDALPAPKKSYRQPRFDPEEGAQ